MGLAASQARLLTLTSRMSDLELQAQSISNSKMRLATQNEQISQDYSNALNTKKLTYLNGDTNTYQDLNYNVLTGADMSVGAQYGVSDTAGNLIVTQAQADAFANASDINGYYANTGVIKTTYPGYTDKAAYEKALTAAQTAYDTAKSNLDNFASGASNNGTTVKGYDSTSGGWTYSKAEAKAQVTDDSRVWGDPHYVINNGSSSYQIDHKGSAGSTYDAFEGDNLQVYSTYGSPNNGYCVITSSKITTGAGTISYNQNGTATITKNGTTSNLSATDGADLGDGSGTKYAYKNGALTVYSADGTGSVSFSGQTISVNGQFANLGGIMGATIANGSSLTAAQCDNYLVDSNVNDGITVGGADVNSKTYTWSTEQTNTYNSKDNPDKVEFVDKNGNVITDANQVATLKATWTSLNTAFTNAQATLTNLKNLPVTTDGDNAKDKTYYTNLYNRMKDGYKVMPNQDNCTNADWLDQQIGSGALTIEKCTDGNWSTKSLSEVTGIVEDSDDTATAKAEADYKTKTAEVEAKDNRYDIELKNIDTEHSAIQSEVDSVKKVIDKNIDRSFKVFDA